MTPGLYRGVLTFLFAKGAIRNVAITLTVGAARQTTSQGRAATGDCVPDSTLQPVITLLGTGTRLPAGIPAVVDARVTDQAGCAFTSGTVVAQLMDSVQSSLGTAELASLADGTWEGRFTPPRAGTATVVLTAQSSDLGITAVSDPVSADIDGPLDGVLSIGNVVSTVTLKPGPVAPGSAITIVGTNMGPPQSQSKTLPWDVQLGGVSARIGGIPLAIAYISDTQIDAVVPFGLKAGTSPQLVIAYGDSLALQPLAVSVQAAQPAITGLIPSGTQPKAGDTITIRCAGLGDVTPTFAATIGTPVPATPAYKVSQPVTLTIGGLAASVVSASLTPGLSGAYDVVAVVPALGPGTYDMQVTVGSASSPGAKITIK